MSVEGARSLRKYATASEQRIWRGLRLLRREGLHFRRQPQIGPYYTDFACHRAKLIIELDGSHHDLPEQKDYDAERSRFLESVGYRVIRLRNIEANEEAIADYIGSFLRRPPPTPPLVGGGGVDRVRLKGLPLMTPHLPWSRMHRRRQVSRQKIKRDALETRTMDSPPP